MFALNYKSEEIVPTPLYHKMEGLFQQEIIRSRALSFRWIFRHALDRYNHLVYFPFRKTSLEEFNLLRPKTTYFSFINVSGIIILWIVSVFIAGATQGGGLTIGSGFGLGVLVALLTSLIVTIYTHFFFSLYKTNIRRSFEAGRQYMLEAQKDSELEEYKPGEDESEQTIDDDGFNERDFSFDDISEEVNEEN
jgi:hypothetical protein